jgi:hypothetical protein
VPVGRLAKEGIPQYDMAELPPPDDRPVAGRRRLGDPPQTPERVRADVRDGVVHFEGKGPMA